MPQPGVEPGFHSAHHNRDFSVGNLIQLDTSIRKKNKKSSPIQKSDLILRFLLFLPSEYKAVCLSELEVGYMSISLSCDNRGVS